MTTTLSDIQFKMQREAGEQVEAADIINWCNQVNMDVGTSIDIPAAAPQNITLLANTVEYTLPVDLKIINRMRLKSDIDHQIDRDIKVPYRIYNGKLLISRVFWLVPDILVVDYFKNMSYFTDIANPIDIDDRFTPLYLFYCKLNFHNQRKPPENVNWRVAINNVNILQNGYTNMRNQVIAYYSLGNEPVVADGRWQDNGIYL